MYYFGPKVPMHSLFTLVSNVLQCIVNRRFGVEIEEDWEPRAISKRRGELDFFFFNKAVYLYSKFPFL